jgi:hypothetical protein
VDRTDTDDPRGLIDCMTASIALRTDSRADPGDHEWDVEPLVARRVPRKGAALWHGQPSCGKGRRSLGGAHVVWHCGTGSSTSSERPEAPGSGRCRWIWALPSP